MPRISTGFFLFFFLLGLNESVCADWPTFGHDIRRSRVSEESIAFDRLGLAWRWSSAMPPISAWSQPAKGDAYSDIRDLPSMRNYDPVFHPIIVGDSVFFASNTDDSVRCVDAITGEVCWTFTTGGPVRIAPTFANGRIYFGSDDGYAYCVDAKTGAQVWRFSPSRESDHKVESQRLVLNDGRLISFWPCRSGVLVDGGRAYFACSLLPWRHSYICSVDSETGKPIGENTYVNKVDDVTLEGALVASADMIYSPQGRTSPLQFRRGDGKLIGALSGAFGVFCVLTPQNHLLFGPSSRGGGMADSKADTRAPIATHRMAKAMIVSGDTSFMLTDTGLAASDMKAKKVTWKIEQPDTLTLMATKDALVLGKRDSVVALDARSGEEVWRAPVDGRVYGLAFANGALLASTDTGHIYCFRPGGQFEDDKLTELTSRQQNSRESATPVESRKPEEIEPLEDESVIGRWVFSPRTAKRLAGNTRFRNLAANVKVGQAATMSGQQSGSHVGNFDAVRLDGKTTSINISQGKVSKFNLPQRSLTAEAWVSIDQPLKWGGIVGAIQDNGSYEKGWILGYRQSKFCFGLAGADANQITFLDAADDFDFKSWHHVVGVYDGTQMALYVDGQLAAKSTSQSGDIAYPEEGFYEIGAYRDDNEFYRVTGLLHEVRVYDRALSAEEVKHHFEAKPLPARKGDWQPAFGPWVQFDTSNSAVVHWQTKEPAVGSLVVRDEIGGVAQFEADSQTTEHRFRVPNLRRDRRYSYEVAVTQKGDTFASHEYEIDTYFNFNLPALPNADSDASDSIAKAANDILRRFPTGEGLCLVLGSETGELATQLTLKSQLRVIGLEIDPKKIAQSRREAVAKGLAGPRLSFVQVDSYDDLPLPPHLAGLIVSQSALSQDWPTPLTELARLLHPNGVVITREEKVRNLGSYSKIRFESSDGYVRGVRAPIEGSGDWTHMYGNASNAAYAGETLAGTKTVNDLEIAWFGRPGPRYQTDRQNRKSAPLYAGGRLYMQGQERIIALNAHNGQVLWSLEIPGLLRFNVPRDTSNWCCDEQYLYVAIGGRLWKIEGATGKIDCTMKAVPGSRDAKFDWGYVGRSGNMLLGSSVIKGSIYKDFWGGAYWFDQKGGPMTHQVSSDNLFAVDPSTGQLAWRYEAGMIWNATITAGEGRVYFVESRDPKLREQPTGRLGLPELWKQQHLVALDVQTGEKLWDQSIETKPNLVLANMALSKGRLVLATSITNSFPIQTFDAKTGELLWSKTIAWLNSDHGGHLSRPAIVGDRLFIRPAVLSMKSGEVLSTSIPRSGCGTYVCSRDAVFLRAGSGTGMAALSIESGEYTRWNRLRPDCWLSTVPAGGMLLSPEGGGGCSCGLWMQMSIGFVPRRTID